MECMQTLLNLRDSAPGIDGIPYSFCQVLASMFQHIFPWHLTQLIRDPDHSHFVYPILLSWIPKALKGDTAHFTRPIGMGTTYQRSLCVVTHDSLTRCWQGTLSPVQVLTGTNKESHAAFAKVQDAL